MTRYTVSPIADENCDSIDGEIILSTDDLCAAKSAAERAAYPYGAGILDNQTGELDVGYGFGVPCPELDEEE